MLSLMRGDKGLPASPPRLNRLTVHLPATCPPPWSPVPRTPRFRFLYMRKLSPLLCLCMQGGDSIPAPPPKAAAAATVQPKSAATRMFHVILPLLLLAVALAINFYLNGQAAAKKQQ